MRRIRDAKFRDTTHRSYPLDLDCCDDILESALGMESHYDTLYRHVLAPNLRHEDVSYRCIRDERIVLENETDVRPDEPSSSECIQNRVDVLDQHRTLAYEEDMQHYDKDPNNSSRSSLHDSCEDF